MKKTYFCIIKDSYNLDRSCKIHHFYNEDGGHHNTWLNEPKINNVYLTVEGVNESFEELKEKIKKGKILFYKDERIRKAEIQL